MAKVLSFINILVVLKLSFILAEPQLTYKKCSMQDFECLTSQVQGFLHKFVEGNPEDHRERLDEMFIHTIEINSNGLKHELQNVKISGLKDSKINDVSFDSNFKMLRILFETNLTTNADYTMSGHLFWKPIRGAGTTTYIAKNMQVEMLIFYEIVTNKDGTHKLKIKRYRSGFIIKNGVEYQFRNLFDGNKKRSDAVHELLNKNWITVTKVFGSKFYYKIFDKIFDAVKQFAHLNNLENMFLL